MPVKTERDLSQPARTYLKQTCRRYRRAFWSMWGEDFINEVAYYDMLNWSEKCIGPIYYRKLQAHMGRWRGKSRICKYNGQPLGSEQISYETKEKRAKENDIVADANLEGQLMLKEGIDRLNHDERCVVRNLYSGGLRLRDIANAGIIAGKNEAQIAYIHKKALNKLRDYFEVATC